MPALREDDLQLTMISISEDKKERLTMVFAILHILVLLQILILLQTWDFHFDFRARPMFC